MVQDCVHPQYASGNPELMNEPLPILNGGLPHFRVEGVNYQVESSGSKLLLGHTPHEKLEPPPSKGWESQTGSLEPVSFQPRG